jgi:hypothetical protein
MDSSGNSSGAFVARAAVPSIFYTFDDSRTARNADPNQNDSCANCNFAVMGHWGKSGFTLHTSFSPAESGILSHAA